jgi:uncharacterized LabA/DUF88 family protein
MIFDDKSNFDGCLRAINKARPEGSRRFWRIEKYYNFFFQKLKSFEQIEDDIKLIRTYVYTGKYNSKILGSLNRFCKKEIDSVNEIIKRETALLDDISKSKIDSEMKKKIEAHVTGTKLLFENVKAGYIKNIEKQKHNSEGQENLFKRLEEMPFLQLKTTDLKQAKGFIYQKGTDVQLATDLVHFAHANAYDIALVLGGDTDLIESVRLVRQGIGKIVVIMAYYDEDPFKSCIFVGLIKEADFFFNIKNLTEHEILSISDFLRQKPNNAALSK